MALFQHTFRVPNFQETFFSHHANATGACPDTIVPRSLRPKKYSVFIIICVLLRIDIPHILLFLIWNENSQDIPKGMHPIFAFAGDNGTMHFWDWRTGYNFQRSQATVQPGSLDSEAGIFAMTFDLSSSRLITCEADKTIKIYKEDDTAVSSIFVCLLSVNLLLEIRKLLFWNLEWSLLTHEEHFEMPLVSQSRD